MNTERLSKCFLSQAPVWFYSTICAKEPGKASMPLIPSTLAHSIKRKRHCSIGGVHLLNPTGVATLFSVFLPNSAQNKHKIFLDKKASGSHIRFPITLSRNMPALQLPSIVLGILHIHSNTLTFLKGTWTAQLQSRQTYRILLLKYTQPNSVFPEVGIEEEALQEAKSKSTYQEKEQNNIILLLSRGSRQRIRVENPRN